MEAKTGRMSGRKAEAARNDRLILDAAQAVFVRDPGAPISAVAEEAGVGVGALYRRYPSKDVLLRTLCADGLHRFIAIAESCLADGADPWQAFAAFLHGIIDSDVHSLTVHLAGTFTPTPEMRDLAVHANTLAERIFLRAQAAGVLHPDLHVTDIPMIFEQITAVRLGNVERTAALRRRYLALLLAALREGAGAKALPGPAPTAEEIGQRWRSVPTEPG